MKAKGHGDPREHLAAGCDTSSRSTAPSRHLHREPAYRTGLPPTIKEHLEKELPNPVEEDSDGFALSYGATRIVILAKPERAKIPPEYHDRIVEFDQLAERLTTNSHR